METVTFEKAIQDGDITIADKFLIVESRFDGYTNTHKGPHAFRVVATEINLGTEEDQELVNEYKVFPVYLDRANDTYVNTKYPVIITDGDEVLFSKMEMDPYGENINPGVLKTLASATKEQNVLHAFDAYVQNAFQLSAYHILVADRDNKLGESDAPFEFTDKFEREILENGQETINEGSIIPPRV